MLNIRYDITEMWSGFVVQWRTPFFSLYLLIFTSDLKVLASVPLR